MTFNLVQDAWIPVRRRSGRVERIAPWQLTEDYDADPFVSFASPRHDFDGAHAQFFIAIMQTAAPPADKRAWRQAYTAPPTAEALRAAFDAVAGAFFLDGDGPRFGQDSALTGTSKDWFGIGQLLPDQPGANAIKNNGDFWIKRGAISALCCPCTASALYALMLNAPAGGAGHRTGLRGGGPITTLLFGATLWQTVWLNVFPQVEFEALTGNGACQNPADRFPWLAPTRTSEPKGGVATTPLDGHPLLAYWATPRRICLVSEASSARDICDLCGDSGISLISHYMTRNYGADYKEWVHPLTPHYPGADNVPLPMHGQPGGAGYRHWLGWVVADNENGTTPAAIVTSRRQDGNTRDLARRLWAFGYDMDKMKARGWVEGFMPLPTPRVDVAIYDETSAGMVHVADRVASTLRQALKAAWYREPKHVRGAFGFIDTAFWQRTETLFYDHLHRLAVAESDDARVPIKESWLKAVARVAEELFVEYAQVGSYDAVDPRRVAMAHRDLRMFTAPSGKRLRALVRLAPVEKTAKASRRTSRDRKRGAGA